MPVTAAGPPSRGGRPGIVVSHGIADDPVRLSIETQDTDIQRVLVIDDPQLGPFRRISVRRRLDHAKSGHGRRGGPSGIIQTAVDFGPGGDAYGPNPVGGRKGDGEGQDGEEKGDGSGRSVFMAVSRCQRHEDIKTVMITASRKDRKGIVGRPPRDIDMPAGPEYSLFFFPSP